MKIRWSMVAGVVITTLVYTLVLYAHDSWWKEKSYKFFTEPDEIGIMLTTRNELQVWQHGSMVARVPKFCEVEHAD